MNLKGNHATPSVSLNITQCKAEKARVRREDFGVAADIIIFLLNPSIHLLSCMSNDDDDDEIVSS